MKKFELLVNGVSVGKLELDPRISDYVLDVIISNIHYDDCELASDLDLDEIETIDIVECE